MSEYIVSARKYRPKKFEEVVGQEGITTALENAIASGKLAQSLLFHGPRGVGKTTCARILAKEINKQANNEDQDYSFNVFELDAASNNGVDDIRNLIDQVRFLPQAGKYKVYIIDEVHMLSTSAFNAFLKTLEEPPSHAIFILATTEKHKIPATILSRCQIYDFKRIESKDIGQYLKKVAEAEGITYEEQALHIIAQKADGALRDALSSFDKLVTFTNSNLTTSLVSKHLNLLDYEEYILLTQELLDEKLVNALSRLNQIISNGFDLHLFIGGFADHFRNIWMCKIPGSEDLMEMSDKVKSNYVELANKVDIEYVKSALDLIQQTDLNYKNTQNQRLSVEICLMKLASINYNTSLKKKA